MRRRKIRIGDIVFFEDNEDFPSYSLGIVTDILSLYKQEICFGTYANVFFDEGDILVPLGLLKIL